MRRFFNWGSALLFGALIAVAMPASAQSDLERDGFFIGFGVGGGSLGAEGSDERESAGVGHFRIGGKLNDKVSLGAESNAWVKKENGATLTDGALTATAWVYPSATSGFFLKGGLGVSRLELDLGFFGSGSTRGTAAMVGAGFDIGFGGSFSLSPVATFWTGRYDEGSTNVFGLMIGVNWN